MKTAKAIIWDYNGTLLNDTKLGVESINTMLSKRGLPLLTTERYREVFTFPVIQYYQKIGFDFDREDWSKTAKEFITNYTQGLPKSHIFPEARDLLNKFHQNGKTQFILSAMEHNMLRQSVSDEDILHYFKEISGIDNFYASSKIENGKDLFKRHNLKPHEVCLLGDTTHDYEVAIELGCSCILIAAGHQSYKKLKETGCHQVVNNLNELISEDTDN